MRSTAFLIVSLIVHAICITALALSHFKKAEAPNGSEVEVTMGDTSSADQAGADQAAQGAVVAATDVKPEPEIKPIEKAPAPTPSPAPAPVAKKVTPKPKKVAKVTPVVATELPAKEQPKAQETQPENMNPQIEDTDAVAVAVVKAEEPKKEEPAKPVPVKETVDAEPAPETVKDAKVEEPAPKAQPKSEPQADEKAVAASTGATAAAGPLGQGGDSKEEAVSYLRLRQAGGNKSPEYPLAARRDQRQGEVGLIYRVTTEGRVTDLQVTKSSGHPDLDEAAVKAVAKFKFVPGQEGWCKHPVIFKLNGVATSLPGKLRTSSQAAAE